MEEAIQNAQEVSDVFTRTMLNEPNVDQQLEEMMRQPEVLPQIPTHVPVLAVGMEAELEQLERVALPA
jgi:hypothetical protein